MKTNQAVIKKVFTTRNMVLISMCTAITSVLSQFSMPLPSGIPLTMQTFGMALSGYILGAKAGCISTAIYVLLGSLGAPIFSNFRGGFSILFGKTGGFLFGFLLLTTLCGAAYEHKRKRNKLYLIMYSLCGILVCHLIGILQFSFITHTNLYAATLLVSLPYLPKDILSVFLAYLASISIHTAID